MCQLNIIKKIKKYYKKKLVKDIKIFLKKENRMQQYGREHYKNLSEDKKHKLVGYRKAYNRMSENILL